MLPASFAAEVPVFMATPTSAWASAGASFVPSPVIATIRPFACSSLISAIFASGVASARKSSTPASCGDHGGGDAVVAGDHHRADAHPPQLVEALVHAALDDVLQVDDAEHEVVLRDDERRAARRGRSCRPPRRARPATRPPCSSTKRLTASAAPLRSCLPSRSTPLIRVVAENGMNVASCSPSSRPRSPYRSFASTTIERPSGVSSASEASCATSASSCSRRRRRPGGTRPPAGCRA